MPIISSNILEARVSLSKEELNDYLINKKENFQYRILNQYIGALGELEAALYFNREGYNIDVEWPIDLIITKNGSTCFIDVKATSKDKWVPKKRFKNKESQEKAFGFSLDEYLRVKILLNPYRVVFNEEDLQQINTYFSACGHNF